MPRSARLDAPGVFHHVIIRRIERRRIFKDNFDRENLLERLSILVPETQTICYAWVFMSNHANEKLDRYYEIKGQGYNIEKVENRVMEIFGLERDVLYSKGRRKIQVAARSLLCYWAVRKLGLTVTELARRLGVTQPAVSYAVSRGERIAKERHYRLIC